MKYDFIAIIGITILCFVVVLLLHGCEVIPCTGSYTHCQEVTK